MIDVNFMKQIAIIVNLSNEKKQNFKKYTENEKIKYEIIELLSKFIVSKFSILKCFNITFLFSQCDYYSFIFFKINSFENRMFIF